MADFTKYQEGIKEFRIGNYERAGELFHEVLDHDDQNPKAWNALGITCSKIGKSEDALTCFENALMLEPGNVTYQNNYDKLWNTSVNPGNRNSQNLGGGLEAGRKIASNRFLSYNRGLDSKNASKAHVSHNQEDDNNPLFLYIPVKRLIFMDLLTFGIFDIYWLYKNYSYLKNRYQLRIDPFGRALFSFFYFYDIFKRIHDDPDANQINTPSFSLSVIAFSYYSGIILQICTAVILGDAEYGLLVWVFIGMQIYAVFKAQSYINDVISLQFPYKDYYGWSTGHIILFVIGLLFWLYIFGTAIAMG